MITNKWIGGSDDISEPLALREEIFVDELGMDEEPERDENDPLSMHLVLYDDGAPVATGRLYHDGKTFRIGRCCVKKEARGQGFGDMLVKLLLMKAFSFNPSEVVISARQVMQDFYARYGFAPFGDTYIEAKEPHIAMRVNKDTLVFPSKCCK